MFSAFFNSLFTAVTTSGIKSITDNYITGVVKGEEIADISEGSEKGEEVADISEGSEKGEGSFCYEGCWEEYCS